MLAQPEAPRALAARHPGALRAILRHDTNLAVQHRHLAAPLRAAAASLAARAPWEILAEGTPAELARTIARHVPPRQRRTVAAEVAALARRFAALTGQPRLRARVDAIADDGCRRFHVDAVGLRLLCTWHGAGTEWLPLAGGGVTARALGARPPVRPRRIPAGSIAILKGEGRAGDAGRGCIHRSPPMGRSPSPRLLLCLDEAGRIPLP